MVAENYKFKKKEKLCLKKQINKLFSDGRWLRSTHIRLIYLEFEELEKVNAQVLFSVPKKVHRTAVARNLIKRRLRESYRLNKKVIYEKLEETGKKVLLAFVYQAGDITGYSIVEREMKHLLSQLAVRISKL